VSRSFCFSVAAVAALAAGPALATDYFVKVDGIAGTSDVVRMTDYIEVQSWSLEFNEGVCRALTFVKLMDKSSASFTAAALSGLTYPTITVIARTPGERPFNYMRLTLTNSVFTSFRTGGTTGDGTPIEQISAQPASVKTDLWEMDERGQRVLVASSKVDCPPS
jgi:type VI protein secretion system component Hcp